MATQFHWVDAGSTLFYGGGNPKSLGRRSTLSDMPGGVEEEGGGVCDLSNTVGYDNQRVTLLGSQIGRKSENVFRYPGYRI